MKTNLTEEEFFYLCNKVVTKNKNKIVENLTIKTLMQYRRK